MKVEKYWPNSKFNVKIEEGWKSVMKLCCQYSTAKIGRSGNSSAPGIDEISYKMLEHLPLKAKILLLKLFNEWWLNQGAIPQLKQTVVCLILKPRKAEMILLLSDLFHYFPDLQRHWNVL